MKKYILLGCLMLLIWSPPNLATTVANLNDFELVSRADRVVYARVMSVHTELTRSGQIYTVARLQVIEDFTGFESREIEVRELGGRWGDTEMFVSGAASYIPGREVIVCLEEFHGGRLRSLAMSFSKFDILPGEGGSVAAFRQPGVLALGSNTSESGKRSLDDFRRVVYAAKGRTSRKWEEVLSSRSSTPIAAEALALEGFTLLGSGMRWNQSDTGASIPWFRNMEARAPVVGSDGVPEIISALNAWSAPTSAKLKLSYAGARSLGGQAPYCNSINLNGGLITFEDPTEEVGSGVLAIGGGCSSSVGAKVVNGHQFQSITNAFVIFNQATELGPNYATPLNFARILTHELGHGIGLGHTPTSTVNGNANIMFYSCCYDSTPVPPRLGSSDQAGLEFIYPITLSPPHCSFNVTPLNLTMASSAGKASLDVSTSGECPWVASSQTHWINITSGNSGVGPTTVHIETLANSGPERTGTLLIAGRIVPVSQRGNPAFSDDLDHDGLPDSWERQFGLSPISAIGPDGGLGDPDADGKTNQIEYHEGTHPRGPFTRYLAEGGTGSFFNTTLALSNPGDVDARVLLRFHGERQSRVNAFVVVNAKSHRSVFSQNIEELREKGFSLIVESDVEVVVDRRMEWDRTGYGAHSETSIASPKSTWYLAEGATHSGLELFYIVQNPSLQTVDLEITYLLPAPRFPVIRHYTVPLASRISIWVNREGAGLESSDVSAKIQSTNGIPIVVERAMYLNTAGQIFGAGHVSSGVMTPALNWFLAEGATGDYFDTFVLIANPSKSVAEISARFLLPSGQVLIRSYVVPPESRFTIWVDNVAPELSNTAVSTQVSSTNGVPIIVERSMWWPGPNPSSWMETHSSVGSTETGSAWAIADGEIGGPRSIEMFLLIANTSNQAGQVRVTLLMSNQQPMSRLFDLNANGRFNVDVAAYFPQARGQQFGALIETVTPGMSLMVERSMYWNSAGIRWAAGTNSPATRIRP